MRSTLVAMFVVWMAVCASARADDEDLEWLLPPQKPQSPWLLGDEQGLTESDMALNELFLFPVRDSSDNTNPLIVRFKVSSDWSVDQAHLTSKQETPDSHDLPGAPRDWKAVHALDMPLPIQRSLFMFGEVNANGDVDQTTSKVKGRTGLGMKFASFFGSELQLRTGPVVTYEELPQTPQTIKSQLSVELQAKVPLTGPLQLKYVSEALPALTQTDHNTLLQDLKLALPLGTNREFSLGAKYKWDDSLNPTPWTQRAELYLGFKYER